MRNTITHLLCVFLLLTLGSFGARAESNIDSLRLIYEQKLEKLGDNIEETKTNEAKNEGKIEGLFFTINIWLGIIGLIATISSIVGWISLRKAKKEIKAELNEHIESSKNKHTQIETEFSNNIDNHKKELNEQAEEIQILNQNARKLIKELQRVKKKLANNK